MSTAVLKLMPVRATLSGRWQAPAFAIGVIVFASGLYRMSATYRPVTFEERLATAKQLREAGALTRLNAYLIYLLKDTKRPAEERAELHRLLASSIHAAEVRYSIHKSANAHSIIVNFDRAVSLGVAMTGPDWVALGDAYFWMGRVEDGTRALRQALRLGVAQPDDLLRRLVDAESRGTVSLSADALMDVDAVLDSERSRPANLVWALDRRVSRLLEQGAAKAALNLVGEVERRLAGSSELPMVRYIESLCLRAEGRSSEAEALLRSLRENCETRDELWARSGWQLGRIQLDDGRPQLAIAFFEEVLSAFDSGPIEQACELGRAEALVELERPERALQVYKSLMDSMSTVTPYVLVDRDAVRTSLTTIGRSLIGDGRRTLGVSYLELALSLVSPSDENARSQYLYQIADGLRRAADDIVQRDSSSEESVESARALYVRAAESSLELSSLNVLNPNAAAEALEAAADDFDHAGHVDRMIDTLRAHLDRFTTEQVESGRARVLHRLGRAYQAIGSFAAAADAYDRVIREFSRQPEALASLVPRAECLLQIGGLESERGERLLIEIVDDRGADPQFTPAAQEYRDALMLLAEYYATPDAERTAADAADAAAEESRAVKAVMRMEDVLALYPDDPRATRMTFLLAESYRQASSALSRRIVGDDPAARREANRRTRAALANYLSVKARLGSMDESSLSALERTYLQASYLYAGDCLFDLEEIETALDAYREAAWRYENEPTAVAAMLQVMHCHERLGHVDEAKAALARMRWLLKKIPEDAFVEARGMSSKAYWEEMTRRLERTALH